MSTVTSVVSVSPWARPSNSPLGSKLAVPSASIIKRPPLLPATALLRASARSFTAVIGAVSSAPVSLSVSLSPAPLTLVSRASPASSRTVAVVSSLAVGAVLSRVSARPADALLVLPALSPTSVSIVLRPSLRSPSAKVKAQSPLPLAVALPTLMPSTRTVTVAPASAPVPMRVGVLLLVILSLSLTPLSESAANVGAGVAAGELASTTNSALSARF